MSPILLIEVWYLMWLLLFGDDCGFGFATRVHFHHENSVIVNKCIWHYNNNWLKKLMVGMLLKVERRIDLVYGGGSVGLMGLVSQAVHHGGRHVLGFALSLSFLSLYVYIHSHIYVCTYTYLLYSCDMMHLLVPSTPLLIIVF